MLISSTGLKSTLALCLLMACFRPPLKRKSVLGPKAHHIWMKPSCQALSHHLTIGMSFRGESSWVRFPLSFRWVFRFQVAYGKAICDLIRKENLHWCHFASKQALIGSIPPAGTVLVRILAWRPLGLPVRVYLDQVAAVGCNIVRYCIHFHAHLPIARNYERECM